MRKLASAMPRVRRAARLSHLVIAVLNLGFAVGAKADTNPPLQLSEGGKFVIATNRARTDDGTLTTTAGFSNERSPRLSYALIDQTQGETSDAEPIKVSPIEPRNIGEALARQPGAKQPVLLYVHGFNNSIEGATHLANHVAGKIGFKGDVAVFSWPSLASWTPASYRADAATVDASKVALAELLQALDAAPAVDRIHIISHSLGNRLLMRTLASAPRMRKLGQILLCSPDVERAEFLSAAPRIVAAAGGATLWVSDNDRALRVAPEFGGGGPRAGLISAGNGPIVLPNMATIDVSNETALFEFNHNAYMQVDDLFADLADVFDQNALRPWLNPAKQRHYARRTTRDNKAYWEFNR
ncbi:alpha/beta hydrolase [Hyphomicrobium album]|nr:alpha/beta hydrolase [Hyphomicrobium album]